MMRIDVGIGLSHPFYPVSRLFQVIGVCPGRSHSGLTSGGESLDSAATAMNAKLIRCDSTYAGEILEIFNDAILTSTALYDYKPRTPEMMAKWFQTKTTGNFPVLGLVDDTNRLLGFGSYGTFRAWPAYKYSLEHSIYIASGFRGRGLGKQLLKEIISAAQEQDYHVLIGGIDSENSASIHLHKAFGFQFAGRIRQVGFKFGRWLDLDFYQLILSTPLQPTEG